MARIRPSPTSQVELKPVPHPLRVPDTPAPGSGADVSDPAGNPAEALSYH